MQVDRNTAAVIRYGDRLIGVDGHGDRVTVACQGFVDRVVDDLEYHVVQAGAVVGVADVHSRPFTDRLKAL